MKLQQSAGVPGQVAKPAAEPTVPAEAVIWALRLFAGRDPVDQAEIAFHQQHLTLDSLRTAFALTQEFEGFYAGLRQTKGRYGAPPFLLRPPTDPTLPWRFEQPTLEAPVSQLCTASQFDEPAFAEIVEALGVHMARHRKLWEHVYIVAVLATEGLIGPGRRGLGFGCGRERIPALLASRGVEVVATDAPAEETFNQGWASTNQFAARVGDLFYPEIIHIEDFDRLVSFQPADMNAIPREFDGQFDCCWSSCSLEHLGSLQHGLDFIENSLASLKPGGVAVHTTEFNLTSDEETIETPGLSIYRRRDLEALVAKLVAQGHDVLPLNLHPGYEAMDEVIDVPPYGLPHLKLKVGQLTLTSVGIVVRKRAA